MIAITAIKCIWSDHLIAINIWSRSKIWCLIANNRDQTSRSWSRSKLIVGFWPMIAIILIVGFWPMIAGFWPMFAIIFYRDQNDRSFLAQDRDQPLDRGLIAIMTITFFYRFDRRDRDQKSIQRISRDSLEISMGNSQVPKYQSLRSIRILRTFRVLRITKILRSLAFMKVILGVIQRTY